MNSNFTGQFVKYFKMPAVGKKSSSSSLNETIAAFAIQTLSHVTRKTFFMQKWFFVKTHDGKMGI